MHLHACVTDGVFMPPATGTASDAPPAFLPATPITQTDLAAVTEKVRRRLIHWLKCTRLLDAEADGHASDGHGTGGCYDRAFFQASPDMLPAIDIHSL